MVARLCCTECKVIAFLYNTSLVLNSCNFLSNLIFVLNYSERVFIIGISVKNEFIIDRGANQA